MKAQWLSSIEEMEQFRGEWTALWNSCPQATPFQSPEWLIPWTRHVFAGGEIRVGTICEGGRLVGLAPFFVYGTDRRFLAFLGAGISEYGDVIALPGYERRCAELALGAFGPEIGLDLTEIPAWSGVLTGKEERCSVCPVLKLPVRDDLVDGIVDPKLRIDLRRARNRLEKQHEFEFTALSVEGGMPELFRLHAARWAVSGEPGVLKGLESFHCEAARQLAARGLLRLYGLRVDGVLAAIIYGFAA
ncbi:MAG TPA: GNAT family N-acetyltransferase, partial [Bryobacteraceae bacterium]|nr:GNAT family N-acetyltransferase [Bryobacteraceae bacterium]